MTLDELQNLLNLKVSNSLWQNGVWNLHIFADLAGLVINRSQLESQPRCAECIPGQVV